MLYVGTHQFLHDSHLVIWPNNMYVSHGFLLGDDFAFRCHISIILELKDVNKLEPAPLAIQSRQHGLVCQANLDGVSRKQFADQMPYALLAKGHEGSGEAGARARGLKDRNAFVQGIGKRALHTAQEES